MIKEFVHLHNDSHFVNYDMNAIMTKHEINHFIESISHSLSIELLERVIQKMLSIISKFNIKRATINSWFLLIRDHVLTMNTKNTRIHEYTASQIMLGFEPKQIHFNTLSIVLFNLKHVEETLSSHQYQIFSTLKDEPRLTICETASYIHEYEKRLHKKQRISRKEDLVLIRNHVVDDQHERKLKSRWLGPRLLQNWTSFRSDLIRELHDEGKAKRYHIDDII